MNRQYVQRFLRLKPNNIEKYIPLARFVIQLKCLGQGRYKGGEGGEFFLTQRITHI